MVLFHLNANTHLYALTRHAYVAVDFFFVLSGFVLMSASGDRVSDGLEARRFALRRLARLYPLHLAALVFLLVLFGIEAWRTGGPIFTGSHGVRDLIQCLFLVQGFTTGALSWNFPSWSISLELWGSLLFGLVLWRARARAWIAFAGLALALAVLVLTLGEPAGPATSEAGAVLKAAHYLMAFFAGATLFAMFRYGAARGWSSPGWLEWPALAVLIGIFLFADRLVSPLSVALFAFAILVFAHEAGPVSAWLRRAWPQRLGRWSYSIYLVHPLWTVATFKLLSELGAWMGRPASRSDGRLVLGGPFAMDLAAIACLLAVVATAALTYRLVERPGMRLANLRPLRAGGIYERFRAWSRRAPRARAT